MKVERGFGHSVYPYVTVSVGVNELLCDGGKLLPYGTWIGTIRLDTFEINQWTPAAYKPRGYKAAAVRVLEHVAAELKRTEAANNVEGALTNKPEWFAQFSGVDVNSLSSACVAR